ncbi:hypothetical protein SRHO_G00037670 [Serrasalmus rhombeus]
MDMNVALQVLLTLAALITCSAAGLQKRYAFLDSSVLTPQDEQRDMGCVEYDLHPAVTLPSHWVYLPQIVVYIRPEAAPSPQPVVIYGRPLLPVNKLPPELEAFLRSYRVGQGAVGPGGAQSVMARPVNIIQLPRRGMSDLLDAVRKGGCFIRLPDAASPGSTMRPLPRP